MKNRLSLKCYFPILAWGPQYTNNKLADDMVAALIVAIMLIPQALAYSLLAGLPVETGLYASIIGLSVYAIFGTSNTLSVAPVAVLSLMTAAALAKLSLPNPEEMVTAALALTFLSGVFLLLLGLLRLGFMANFLSHPVISSFVTASALIIGFSQMQYILGVSANGQNFLEIIVSLVREVPNTNLLTLALGAGSIVFIVFWKTMIKSRLLKLGLDSRIATTFSRAGPLLIALITGFLAYALRLDQQGIQLLSLIHISEPTRPY